MPKKHQNYVFKTKNGNYYNYNEKEKAFIYCHPIIKEIGTYYKNNTTEPEKIKKNLESKYCKKEVSYYITKYQFLKNKGYFDNQKEKISFKGRLSSKHIENILSNSNLLTFEVTDSCNLKCEYCGYGKFYSDYDKRENNNLDIKAAKNLIDYLSEYWNSSLNNSLDKNIYIGFYGGEPLLNFNFINNIVEYTKTKKLKKNRITYSMTTNAILLDKYMDFLAKENFSLLISLDGDEFCNSYRVFHNGKSAYDKIVNNVKLLKEKYPEYFKNSVNFNAVLHNRNSVGIIYKYFNENFGKIPSVSELNTGGIKEELKEEFWTAYSNTMESLYQSEDYKYIEKEMFIKLPSLQSVGSFIHNLNNFSVRNYNGLFKSKHNDKKQNIPTGTCKPFSKKIFVTATGKILACERIGHQFSLGNITSESVNLDLEKIAEKYNSYYRKMEKLCSTCYNKKHCAQCIFYLNIDDEKVKCEGYTNKEDYKNYLSSHLNYLENNRESYKRILKEVVID